MSHKPSNLPEGLKRQFLDKIREQAGQEEYNQLIKIYGEDRLLDQILEQSASHTNQWNLSKASRSTGFLAGISVGILTGIVFLIAAWTLNISLKVPFRYSLAALTIGAIVSIPTGIIIISNRKHNSLLEFRSLFRFYFLASVIGGLIGVGRWLFQIDVSIMSVVNSFYESFSANCLLPVLGIAAIIAAVVWVITLGKSSGVQDAITTPIVAPFAIIFFAIIPIALLADAPLWRWFTPLLDQHAIVITAIWTTGLGAILGFYWPPLVTKTD